MKPLGGGGDKVTIEAGVEHGTLQLPTTTERSAKIRNSPRSSWFTTTLYRIEVNKNKNKNKLSSPDERNSEGTALDLICVATAAFLDCG